MPKIKMGLYDGTPDSFSHEKAHLDDVGLPNPQEHANAKSAQGMSAGKGPETQELGAGKSSGSGSIKHIPGKGPGTPQGMTAGKAKGLDTPFGSTKTKG